MIPRISSTSSTRRLPLRSVLSGGRSVERNTGRLASFDPSRRYRLVSGSRVFSVGRSCSSNTSSLSVVEFCAFTGIHEVPYHVHLLDGAVGQGHDFIAHLHCEGKRTFENQLVSRHRTENVVHERHSLGYTLIVDSAGEVKEHDVVLLTVLHSVLDLVEGLFRFCDENRIRVTLEALALLVEGFRKVELIFRISTSRSRISLMLY